MAKNCATETTAQRQRWIEAGLQELMLKSKFDQITVTDLCRHLELPRRTFYRYFRDLEDVLDSLLNHTFQDLALSGHILDSTEMQRGYEFWIRHRKLLDALKNSGMTDKLYEYTLRYTEFDSIGRYLADDQMDMDIRQETRLFVISGFVSLVIAWHSDDFRKTPAEMARIAERMLFHPILKRN